MGLGDVIVEFKVNLFHMIICVLFIPFRIGL